MEREVPLRTTTEALRLPHGVHDPSRTTSPTSTPRTRESGEAGNPRSRLHNPRMTERRGVEREPLNSASNETASLPIKAEQNQRINKPVMAHGPSRAWGDGQSREGSRQHRQFKGKRPPPERMQSSQPTGTLDTCQCRRPSGSLARKLGSAPRQGRLSWGLSLPIFSHTSWDPATFCRMWRRFRLVGL